MVTIIGVRMMKMTKLFLNQSSAQDTLQLWERAKRGWGEGHAMGRGEGAGLGYLATG